MTSIAPAQNNHASQIHKLETESFSDPWSVNSIVYEIEHSLFLVACNLEGSVIGYISMRHIVDEGHINNIAVSKVYRKLGVGSQLMESLLHKSAQLNITAITLEVRASNKNAISLYQKYGFTAEGYRKSYYQNPVEDAAIMWRYI